MTLNRKMIRTSLMGLVFVLLMMPAQPAFAAGSDPVQSESSLTTEIEFALTGKATGWLRSGSRLFRTESNGADWRDVTPTLDQNQRLEDVYFLDSERAFALAISMDSEKWQLNLMKTMDAGASWQAQPVILQEADSELLNLPFGKGFLQWQGSQNGWILIKQATSSNFSLGFLLHTNDAGQSWEVSEPPAAEEFVFTDDKLGFMRDPTDPTLLYQTQDGGKSWQSNQPLAADSAEGELQRVELPTQWQGGEVLLPVWIKAGETEPELAFLTAQGDSRSLSEGTVWAQAQVAINPQSWQESFGSDLTFTQLSSYDGKYMWLGLNESACSQGASAGVGDLPLSSLSCESKSVLLSSEDGGEHWEALNLPDGVLPAITSTLSVGTFQNMPVVDDRLNTVQWRQIYQGQGFDVCEIPTLSKLQTWFNASPYQSVNLYIGGNSRSCSNTALSATYLQQMFNQGWRFIPTWVGPQAPCTSFTNKFSSKPGEAYAEGVDNANQARARLLALGLTNSDGSGSVVYYDLEYFDYSTTCSAAARAFVRGWTTRLQELGIASGLYATSSNLNVNQIYNLQPPPQVVWIAEWYSTPGYRPDVTVWDVDWLDDYYWTNHQRILQYSGSHNETWGGVTINIDNDVLDGIVAAPYGADLTAPVTSYKESGTVGISPWYKTPVTVTLTATDNSVGVKHTYYRVNSGTWQLYTGPFQLGGSEQKTIGYVSVDRVNNWETLKSASFYVDSEPPVNPVVTSPGCQAWNGVPQPWCNDPNFTWSGAYDKGVGLNPTDTYEYYWGPDYGATSGTRTSSTQFNPPAIPTGVPYFLRIRTQDRQGLWSSWQTVYTLFYDPRYTHRNWLPRVGK